jgi:CBS domain-containing protein
MMGAALGLCLAALVPDTDPRLWALVCMAAVLGGMMRAPLMAVVFAFELSHDVNALLPLLLASAVAYGFTVLTMPRSILTEKIARRGFHIHREYGADPMERIAVSELMTSSVVAIEGDRGIGEVVNEFFGSAQSHRAYPVVEQGRYLGMLDREMLAHSRERFDEPVATLVRGSTPVVVLPQETARLAAARMASADVERLAVVEDRASHFLIGILSRSDLVEPAKQLHEEELKRERFLGWNQSGS